MAQFLPVDRATPYLLPPSVDECLPESHLLLVLVERGGPTRCVTQQHLAELAVMIAAITRSKRDGRKQAVAA